MVAGSCLCGTVAWECAAPIEGLTHCHCTRCRKSHGAPFATYGTTAASDFRVTRGREAIVKSGAAPDSFRCFCSLCGSVVPDGSGFGDKAFVPAGPFDRDPGVRPALHLFAASKAPWWEIEDGLPQFDAFPPGIDAPVLPDRAPLDPPGGVRGSCLCGEVAYVAAGPVIRMWLCHCSRCRRARAAAHNANMFVPLAGLRFTRGASSVATFKPPDAQFFAQSFCTRCGSKMPRLDEARGAAVVPMGTLDDDPIERPSAHIFVASKAPWYEIPGRLPQFEERPPMP